MTTLPRVSRTAGFSLVDLLSVLVILGSIASVVIPVYADLRRAAGIAALDRMGVDLGTAFHAAINRHRVAGQATSVTVNGKTIPVFPAGSTSTWFMTPFNIPAGSPTGPGMYVLFGCGDTPPVANPSDWIQVPCPRLPARYQAWLLPEMFSIYDAALGGYHAVTYAGYVGYDSRWSMIHDEGWWGVYSASPGWFKEYYL